MSDKPCTCNKCHGELRYRYSETFRGVPTKVYVCMRCGATEYHSSMNISEANGE